MFYTLIEGIKANKKRSFPKRIQKNELIVLSNCIISIRTHEYFFSPPKAPSSFNNGVLFRPLPHLLQRLGLSQDLMSLLLDSEESYLAA